MINIKYNDFDDLPPDEKSEEELTMLVLRSASGESFVIRKYSEQEVNQCVRKLIEKGMVRGTILDKDLCSWSRLTQKGRLYLALKKKHENKASHISR